MTRRDAWCLLLYFTLAVATSFADLRMRAYPARVVQSYIPGIVAGTEEAPGIYRVLAPFLVYDLSRLTGASLQSVWYVTRLLWCFAAFAAMHLYLRAWFAPGAALAGVALTGATLPLLFTNSWAHPDQFPELALFTASAWAIATNRDVAFAILLGLASLNRETAVFLVLLYVVAGPLTRDRLVRAAMFGAEWLAIYAGLRFARGLQHYDYWQLMRNLEFLKLLPPAFDPYYRAYAYFGLIAFGPMIYVASRATAAPLFARRALLVIAPFVVVAMLFSSIVESRIFTPIFTLVAPAVMFALFDPIRDSGELSC